MAYIRIIFLVIRIGILKIYLTRIERLSFSIYKNIPLNIHSEVEYKYIDLYIKRIRKLNKIKFIAFQFISFGERYAENLLKNLPELFVDLSEEDLVEICYKIHLPLRVSAYLAFIARYLEADYMSIFNQANIKTNLKKMASEELQTRGRFEYKANDKFSIEIRKLKSKQVL